MWESGIWKSRLQIIPEKIFSHLTQRPVPVSRPQIWSFKWFIYYETFPYSFFIWICFQISSLFDILMTTRTTLQRHCLALAQAVSTPSLLKRRATPWRHRPIYAASSPNWWDDDGRYGLNCKLTTTHIGKILQYKHVYEIIRSAFQALQ